MKAAPKKRAVTFPRSRLPRTTAPSIEIIARTPAGKTVGFIGRLEPGTKVIVAALLEELIPAPGRKRGAA